MPKRIAIANGANPVEQQAARDANETQDACNLIAIVGCWHRHLVAMSRTGIGGDNLSDGSASAMISQPQTIRPICLVMVVSLSPFHHQSAGTRSGTKSVWQASCGRTMDKVRPGHVCSETGSERHVHVSIVTTTGGGDEDGCGRVQTEKSAMAADERAPLDPCLDARSRR